MSTWAPPRSPRDPEDPEHHELCRPPGRPRSGPRLFLVESPSLQWSWLLNKADLEEPLSLL